MVVGGVACVINGYVRTTEALDLLIDAERENVERLLSALARHGEGYARELAVADFTDEEGAVRLIEDFPIDLFTRLGGLRYADLLPYRAVYLAGDGKTEIPHVDAEGLIRFKSKSHREQDRIDVQALRRLRPGQESYKSVVKAAPATTTGLSGLRCNSLAAPKGESPETSRDLCSRLEWTWARSGPHHRDRSMTTARARPKPFHRTAPLRLGIAALLCLSRVAAQTPSGSCPDTWLPMFAGGAGANGPVYAVTEFDDGSGPAMFVAGSFTSIANVAASGIAKWDGQQWSTLGAGLGNSVVTLEVFDDGTGPALYAGGSFVTAGGAPAKRIAKWDGAQWSPLAGGVDGYLPIVNDMAVHDDGQGAALYIVGDFSSVDGGLTANGIAKWSGSAWSAIGGFVPQIERGFCLESFNDGSGPALYAGGQFFAMGGVVSNNIAKWQFGQWSALQGGTNSAVHALAVWDDGSGPALFAGGSFAVAGGVAAQRIAKWTGGQWSPLGSGVGASVPAGVLALEPHTSAGVSRLYVGGAFQTAGSLPAANVAAFDGSTWSPMGPGVAGIVYAMSSQSTGTQAALFVGGNFLDSPALESNLAQWGQTPGCAPVIYCTAKLSTSGCQPLITGVGRASLSSPASFAVTSSQLEANRFGLQFFGTTGPADFLFDDGTLCVNPPLHRLVPKNSGGVASCSGVMTYTLAEVLAQPSGGALVVLGQQVNQQGWFRDPPALTGTGLTNALQYMVVP